MDSESTATIARFARRATLEEFSAEMHNTLAALPGNMRALCPPNEVDWQEVQTRLAVHY